MQIEDPLLMSDMAERLCGYEFITENAYLNYPCTRDQRIAPRRLLATLPEAGTAPHRLCDVRAGPNASAKF